MTVTVLQGLPGSGKSTYAKEQCKLNPNLVRINKDDLRAMFCQPYSRETEEVLNSSILDVIEVLLGANYDVILDSTNFNNKYIDTYVNLAKKFEADIDIKLIDTPLDECIARDKIRESSVGEQVITNMYNKYLSKNEESSN
jgi:predicted kinase